jgi:hypothetical protein
MENLIIKIGLFLASTDIIALNNVGRDRFSILKQNILGYSIFIPTIIAFFSLRHMFSLVVNNSELVIFFSILGAFVVLFLDYSILFFLSIYQRFRLYTIRICYSCILGFFFALVATIGFNVEHLNDLYKEQYIQENDYKKDMQGLKDSIKEANEHIENPQTSNNKKLYYNALRRSYKEDLQNIEDEISKVKLKDLFSEVSFLYLAIIKNNNYLLGFQTLFFLILIMSFDIMPIFLKIIGFETKYDIYVKINYYKLYKLEKDRGAGNSKLDDTIIDNILSFNLDDYSRKESRKRNQNLKIYYNQLREQLYNYSKISLLKKMFFSKTTHKSESTTTNIASTYNGHTKKIKKTLSVFYIAAGFTIPEVLVSLVYLSFDNINNLAVYFTFSSMLFYANRLLILFFRGL